MRWVNWLRYDMALAKAGSLEAGDLGEAEDEKKIKEEEEEIGSNSVESSPFILFRDHP